MILSCYLRSNSILALRRLLLLANEISAICVASLILVWLLLFHRWTFRCKAGGTCEGWAKAPNRRGRECESPQRSGFRLTWGDFTMDIPFKFQAGDGFAAIHDFVGLSQEYLHLWRCVACYHWPVRSPRSVWLRSSWCGCFFSTAGHFDAKSGKPMKAGQKLQTEDVGSVGVPSHLKRFHHGYTIQRSWRWFCCNSWFCRVIPGVSPSESWTFRPFEKLTCGSVWKAIPVIFSWGMAGRMFHAFFCIIFSGNTFAEATVASKQFGTKTSLKLWLLHLEILNLGSSVGRGRLPSDYLLWTRKLSKFAPAAIFKFEVPQDQVELDRMQCLFFGSIPLAIFHADGCR